MALKKKWPGGFQDALNMLQGMSRQDRERILQDMLKKDPEMAIHLQNNLITFDQLQYLTPAMVQNLMRDLDARTLGLAFRACKKEVSDVFLSNVSKGIKSEILEELNGVPKRLSEVEKAQEEILKVVKEKVARGEIVLDKEGSETLV